MNWYTLLYSLSLAALVAADPTWPSKLDDLEEIMFQMFSFRSRNFADLITPCSKEASGPGRQNAAEWLRTGFHDMSTANVKKGTGGLDGSLQYELNSGENAGPGLRTTLQAMAPYVSKQTSLSDLIALGVYASVRSCGGPRVPVRAGRKDAAQKGALGVPQPEDSVDDFAAQFERMGFEHDEAIAVTACGHTLGGVHSSEFPDLVPRGSVKKGLAPLDTSIAAFDNRIVTEYVDGTTRNPLVVGPSVKLGKHSDFKLFNSDGNDTMERLRDADEFRETCKIVLQKMIDTVPSGVSLTDPIVPYSVKPVNLQLTLDKRGTNLLLTGFIRVRTTDTNQSPIKSVIITYKNRKGGSSCGSGGCSITLTKASGTSRGFDDTFAFFPIEASIPVSSGISSFTVTVKRVNGSSKTYSNNGQAYPLRDAVFLQKSQTCRPGSGNSVRLVAAVRRDRASRGARATVYYKTAQEDSPVPRLRSETVELKGGECLGQYMFFKGEYKIRGGLAEQAHVDVVNGDEVDGFKRVREFREDCGEVSETRGCE